jgi:hypothetical protein
VDPEEVLFTFGARGRRPLGVGRAFSPAEIACRSTGKLLLNEAALNKLQALRDALAKPLIVPLAYRSPETTAPSAALRRRSTQ